MRNFAEASVFFDIDIGGDSKRQPNSFNIVIAIGAVSAFLSLLLQLFNALC
jgi:hypothetical protein